VALERANINQIEDLKGKRYTPSFPGQTGYVVAEQVLKVHGLTYDDPQLRPQGWAEAHNAMKDLQLDALSWITTVPQPTFIDLSKSHPVKLVGFRPDMLDKFLQQYPMYSKYVIKANTYPFQKEDVLTIVTSTDIICHKDVPEEAVYRLTKTIYENHAHLVGVHQSCEYMTVQNSLNDLTIPLHPGAARYYQEIGAKIPDKIRPID